MSVVEFIMNIKDRGTTVLDRVTEKGDKARRSLEHLDKVGTTTFDGATRGAKDLRDATERQIDAQAKMRAQAEAYWKRENAERLKRRREERTSLNSIAKIQQRIEALNKQRKLVDPSDVATLGKYNRELWHLNERLKQINQTGLEPAAAPARARRFGMINTRTAGGGFLGGLLGRSNLYMAGGLAVAGGISKAIQTGAEQQYTRVQMQNEFGASGSSMYDSLRGQRGSLGENVEAYGMQLARAGMRQRDLIPTMRRLGDVANGNDSRMASLVETFAELEEKGTLTRASLENLKSAGFDPLREMSRNTGEGFKSLFERLDNGKITIDEVRESLRRATSEGGEFFGNLDRLDETTLTRWRNFKNTIGEIAGNFGENLLGALNLGGSGNDKPTWLDEAAFLSEKWKNDDGIWGQIMNTSLLGGSVSLLGLFGNADKGAQSLGSVKPKSATGKSVEDEYFAELRRREKQKEDAEIKKADPQAQEKVNQISGGGQRVYNITVGKLIETMNNTFQGTVRENATEINRIISEELIKLLASTAGR